MRKIIDQCGNIFYYNKNCKYHREDGPAIESTDGNNRYWYNGIYYSEIETDEEWARIVKLMIFQ